MFSITEKDNPESPFLGYIQWPGFPHLRKSFLVIRVTESEHGVCFKMFSCGDCAMWDRFVGNVVAKWVWDFRRVGNMKMKIGKQLGILALLPTLSRI